MRYGRRTSFGKNKKERNRKCFQTIQSHNSQVVLSFYFSPLYYFTDNIVERKMVRELSQAIQQWKERVARKISNRLAKRGLYIISSTSCDRQRTLPDVVLAIHRGNIIRHLYDCIEQLYSRRCLPLVFSPFRNTTDTTHCMRSEKETNKIKQNQKKYWGSNRWCYMAIL
jgi:hypothetical protein